MPIMIRSGGGAGGGNSPDTDDSWQKKMTVIAGENISENDAICVERNMGAENLVFEKSFIDVYGSAPFAGIVDISPPSAASQYVFSADGSVLVAMTTVAGMYAPTYSVHTYLKNDTTGMYEKLPNNIASFSNQKAWVNCKADGTLFFVYHTPYATLYSKHNAYKIDKLNKNVTEMFKDKTISGTIAEWKFLSNGTAIDKDSDNKYRLILRTINQSGEIENKNFIPDNYSSTTDNIILLKATVDTQGDTLFLYSLAPANSSVRYFVIIKYSVIKKTFDKIHEYQVSSNISATPINSIQKWAACGDSFAGINTDKLYSFYKNKNNGTYTFLETPLNGWYDLPSPTNNCMTTFGKYFFHFYYNSRAKEYQGAIFKDTGTGFAEIAAFNNSRTNSTEIISQRDKIYLYSDCNYGSTNYCRADLLASNKAYKATHTRIPIADPRAYCGYGIAKSTAALDQSCEVSLFTPLNKALGGENI